MAIKMSVATDFLSQVKALLLEQGLGKARKAILTKQLEKYGGAAVQTLSQSTTHILVGNNTRLARVPVLLKVDSIPDNVSLLRADWLSASLTKGQLVSEESYQLREESSVAKQKHLLTPPVQPPPEKAKLQSSAPHAEGSGCQDREQGGSGTTTTDSDASMSSPKAGMFAVTRRKWTKSPKKAKEEHSKTWDSSDSDYVESDGEEEVVLKQEEKRMEEDTIKSEVKAGEASEAVGEFDGDKIASPPPKKKGRWICEIASSKAQTWTNHNKHITDKLEELLTVYQNNGEKWRAMSTIKVIQAVKKHPREITTLEEARSVPFVGDRLADKIYEIVSRGDLRRLENVDKEKERIIKMFKNIHGVGLITAQQFYAQGYRTLQDLKDANILNRVQLIGVRHFDEFIERMQREEVAEIEAKVKEIAHDIDSGLEVVTCGSYRRGKLTCGDIDILITHPDGRSHKGVFDILLKRGHACGFLTDDLSVHNEASRGKYLGVCKLEGEGRKHRRIDIMLVPYCEFPLALLHFTGSGHMNRSMRSKADKMGMSLSEHALCTGVIRKNGVKIFDGTPLPVTCEQDVFRYLELKYLEPLDRDWD